MKRVTVSGWALIPLGVLLVVVGGLAIPLCPVGACAYWAVPQFLVGLVGGFTAFCGGLTLGSDRFRVPIPYPDRSRRLQKRLVSIQATRGEIERVMRSLSEGSAHAENLRIRLEQLEEAENTLKIEMSYGALGALDKRAGKLVRKELGK